jgi:transcriptional regulator with XRE-family HTH domain
MISVGESARALREQLGLSQKEAADLLEITNVHLCNIEKNNSHPSLDLIAKYRELWGVDLYILAWCENGNVQNLPKPVRSAAQSLAAGWRKHIERQISKRREAAG